VKLEGRVQGAVAVQRFRIMSAWDFLRDTGLEKISCFQVIFECMTDFADVVDAINLNIIQRSSSLESGLNTAQ